MDNEIKNEVINKKNNVSYKKIFLIFGVTVVIILALAMLFYINISKDTSRMIKANIKYVGDDYIIVTDNDSDDEYIIDVDEVSFDEECEVGDELSLTIDKINDNKEPIEAEAKNIKIISKAKKDVIIEKKDSDIAYEVENQNTATTEVNNNNINSSNDVENNNTTSTLNESVGSSNVVSTDDDVVRYFDSVNTEIDKSVGDKKLSESAKNGFVTLVDFLFYDKAIKGKTFKELTTSAKIKVLKLGIIIDTKLENNFPNYKNTLASKYQNIKTRAISVYLEKATEICSKNEDTCVEAKKGLADLKNNFSITWSFIKDISGVGLSKLKSWYEIWRDA